MTIETSSHKVYSYLHSTNEIVSGVVKDDYTWKFEPLKIFDELPMVDMVIIGVTEQCNLRCTYCCYSGKYKNNRLHSSRSLNQEDIDSILLFIENNVKKRPIRIAFYGGEPLMCYDLIQYAIIQAEIKFGEEVTFSVSTNSVLLSEEKIDWFIDHAVELLISVDGTERYHDLNRKGPDGFGSFSRVKKALSYVADNQMEYFDKVQLMMTLPNIENLLPIAEEWSKDEVLRMLKPANITALAPNFETGVKKQEFNDLQKTFRTLLDAYQIHRDWSVLKAYLDGCLIYWNNRPITEPEETVLLATCLPFNTKLYIDAQLDIGVCEKFADQYRIGNVSTGIDYKKSNELVSIHYARKEKRCKRCTSYHMCDLCLTSIEFLEDQFDILCHNEQIYCKLFFWLFCEMAERGMMPLKKIPELHTKRCGLREITETDIPDLQAIFADVQTKIFLSELYEYVRTNQGMTRFLHSTKSAFLHGEGLLWGILESDKLIGFLGVTDLSSVPTIYFAIHSQYRNKGLMTEVLDQVLNYLYESKLCTTLKTEVYIQNVISQRLLTRCGFKLIDSDADKVYFSLELTSRQLTCKTIKAY